MKFFTFVFLLIFVPISFFSFAAVGVVKEEKTSIKKEMRRIKNGIRTQGKEITQKYESQWDLDSNDTKYLLMNYGLKSISNIRKDVVDGKDVINFEAKFLTVRNNQEMTIEYTIKPDEKGKYINSINAKVIYDETENYDVSKPEFKLGSLQNNFKSLRTFNLLILSRFFEQCEFTSIVAITPKIEPMADKYSDEFFQLKKSINKHSLSKLDYGKNIDSNPNTKIAMKAFLKKYYPLSKLSSVFPGNELKKNAGKFSALRSAFSRLSRISS